jgi:ligand-binding sensor domain-containing protein
MGVNQALKTITLADGIPNLSIIKILRDKQDNIWISTQNGICAYNLENKTDSFITDFLLQIPHYQYSIITFFPLLAVD